MPGLSKGKGEPVHKNKKSQGATSHRPWLFPCSQDTAHDSHAGHASFAIPCAPRNSQTGAQPVRCARLVRLPATARSSCDSGRLAQPARRTHAQHAPHTLEHREQLLVGRVVERVNQIAHLRKLALQLVEPHLDPIFLRTREHAQASELLA